MSYQIKLHPRILLQTSEYQINQLYKQEFINKYLAKH